jgi:glycine/D-amino acid oxidase-like deaminating enzyme
MTFVEYGPYLETPADRSGPLETDLDADVAIVGAGYTGLSTALALRSAGVDAVLLDADFAGAGGSGRNAGHLTPTIGKDLPTLLRIFGRARASALVRFADAAVEHTERVMEKHAIACDYRPSGNLLAAVHPKQQPRLERAAEAGTSLGGRVRFVAEGEMRERGLPAAFLCGMLEEAGGTFDPGKYVLGLRRAARAAGAQLFEQTPVEAIEEGARVRLRTPRGTVTADRIVIATNGYTASLGWRRRAVVPLACSLLETEPIGEQQRRALGWPGGEGIYTAHEILESYRPTARGSIVGGVKTVRYGYGSRLPAAEDPRTFEIVEAAFRERFPELRDVGIRHFWSGWLGYTPDFLPSLGVSGSHRNVHHAFGFAGHGVAQGTLMGDLVAEQLQGREHPLAKALVRRSFAWPPEPLRWLAFQAIHRTLAALDARTDRQVRRRRAG